MALNFRKGVEAIKAAQENTGGGFSPWAPIVSWREDKEEKYVLFLTPIEDVPLVDLHEFVPLGQGEKNDGGTFDKYGFFISRKDQAIGEDFDPLEELGFKPKQRNIAVAIELEPKLVQKGNRSRPEGFEVKTETYTRKGDDEQEEEVTTPVVGIVTQAPSNFFGYLGSFEESEGPVTETPFKVKRRGKDKNTEYDFTPYLDLPVDVSKLLDNLDGISYLNEELDAIIEECEDKDDETAAQIVARYLLDARLSELADGEAYQEAIDNADPDTLKPRYGGGKKGGGKKNNSRPARRSQRSASSEETDDAPEETSEETKEKKPSAAKQSRFEEMKKKAAARKATSDDDE